MSAVMMECGHAANATVNGKDACVICVSTTVAETPNLEGRQSKCQCGKVEPSSTALAFFQYRGPGSKHATERCKCGYYARAHTKEGVAGNVNPRTVIEDGRCKYGAFTPAGPDEFDTHYDGCRGWD